MTPVPPSTRGRVVQLSLVASRLGADVGVRPYTKLS